ncbi:MAG: 2-succinyl-6-hydroxy-2,4-cyclohexadiene-1-carboxylate synthase [Gemmatimonadetes bacterium]|nr:2-succinyl-6-hydroxy-2,4-cyclohexadiene-1-carboxylate synthase [Gemmatimonadota bacterium]NNM04855.1 2-succinyl-6-hydroxy-2,4-cyclohexadiene-1-carboxylate synthase [Gemmatimonadota bacterium]
MRDDLRVNVLVQGAGDPLLLIHGFTGSCRSWGEELLSGLGQAHRVIAVDLVGHGQSDVSPDPDRYQVDELLQDLGQILDAVGVEKARWLGYSMGGRLSLAGAVRTPDRMSGLILESASPGLAEEGERRARRRADEALAEGILRGGMEAFVDHWMGLPLFATQGKLPPAIRVRTRERKLQNTPEALAACLRGMGTGVQPSFWDALPEVTVPVLLMAGEKDRKFTQVAERMAEGIPDAELRLIPKAGHAIHLENPFAWLAAVRTFAPS